MQMNIHENSTSVGVCYVTIVSYYKESIIINGTTVTENNFNFNAVILSTNFLLFTSTTFNKSRNNCTT